MTESDDAFEDEIIEIFVEEVTDVIEIIDVNVQLWQETFVVDRSLKELRRAFHTLKGSGRMVNADAIGELGWSLENLINRIIDGLVEADKDIVSLIIDVRNILPTLLDAFKNRQAAAVSGVNVQTYIDRSNKLMLGDKVEAPVISAAKTESSSPFDNVEQLAPLAEAGVASDHFIETLKLQQQDLSASVTAMKLDLNKFNAQVDEIAKELQLLSRVSSSQQDDTFEDKLQSIELLRSEVSDLQYFVNANSKQFAAENNAQKELARAVNHSIEKAQAQQQEQLNQLRLEVKAWSVGAAMFCSALALGLLVFIN